MTTFDPDYPEFARLVDPDPDVDLDAYEPNDPKRWALDPGFDPDFMRDQWRGK